MSLKVNGLRQILVAKDFVADTITSNAFKLRVYRHD